MSALLEARLAMEAARLAVAAAIAEAIELRQDHGPAQPHAAAGGDKGYNPYRSSDGKFGAGAHKARPTNPRTPAAAKPVTNAGKVGAPASTTKPHAVASARAAVDKAKKSPTHENITAAKEAVSAARGQPIGHQPAAAQAKPAVTPDHHAEHASATGRAKASLEKAQESSDLAKTHADKGEIEAARTHAADAKRHHEDALKHSDEAIAHAKNSGDEKLHENAKFNKEDVEFFGGNHVRTADHAVRTGEGRNPGSGGKQELGAVAKTIADSAHRERVAFEQALRDADFEKATVHADALISHADALSKAAPDAVKERWSPANRLVVTGMSAHGKIADAKESGHKSPEHGALKAAEYDHLATTFSAGITKDQASAVRAYSAHTDRILNPTLRQSGGAVDQSARLYAGHDERATQRAGLDHDKMFSVAGHPSSTFDTAGHTKGNISLSSEVHNLDSAIKSTPLSKDALVYRTVADPGGAFTGHLKEGSSFVDHGYVSTSANKNFMNDFYQSSGLAISGKPNATADRVDFHIQLKAGQHAAPIANEVAGYKANESEMLLPRSSKFTVTKVVEARDGRPKEVHMEVSE